MATIPQKLHDILAEGHTIWVATVGADGMPNVSIKGSGSLLAGDRVIFADLYHRETLENLERDPRIAVGVHDHANKLAMQVKGRAEILDHGDLVDDMRRRLAAVCERLALPPVQHVVVVTVDSVVDLWPGPHAGEEVRAAGTAG